MNNGANYTSESAAEGILQRSIEATSSLEFLNLAASFIRIGAPALPANHLDLFGRSTATKGLAALSEHHVRIRLRRRRRAAHPRSSAADRVGEPSGSSVVRFRSANPARSVTSQAKAKW